MDYLLLIILATAGSVLSLAGGFVLLSNQKLAQKIAGIGAPFAAGALIAAALVDLIPEAIEAGTVDTHQIGIWALVGIASFFLLERKLNWFHHHHEHKVDRKHTNERLPAMLVIGDTLHNAIDGCVIAITFLVNPSLGIVTTFAVALHEVPQEIGDFSLLLKAGWSRKKVIMVNILSAVATVVSALVVFSIGSSLESVLPIALAITAGILLYIASSDVIPQVHAIKPKSFFNDSVSILFILGLAITSVGVLLAHQFIE